MKHKIKTMPSDYAKELRRIRKTHAYKDAMIDTLNDEIKSYDKYIKQLRKCLDCAIWVLCRSCPDNTNNGCINKSCKSCARTWRKVMDQWCDTEHLDTHYISKTSKKENK